MEYVVDINKIIKICPHYDEINNYDFDYDDKITIDLIYWYKELTFSIDLDTKYYIKMLNRLDYCIYKYISDLFFQKILSNYFKINKVIFSKNNDNMILNIIFYITYQYDEENFYNIKKSKWIIF